MAANYKDPRWQKKRLEVLERDGWKCCYCDSKDNTLNVHHTYYKKGKAPWEYSAKSLRTLCEDCHEEEHRELSVAKEKALEAIGRLGVNAEGWEYIAMMFYNPKFGEGRAAMAWELYLCHALFSSKKELAEFLRRADAVVRNRRKSIFNTYGEQAGDGES